MVPRSACFLRSAKDGAHLTKRRALAVFALFSCVELRDGAVVAHHACPDFAAGSFGVGDVFCFHKLGMWNAKFEMGGPASSFQIPHFKFHILLGGVVLFEFAIADRAELVLAGEIAVLRADGKCGRDREVGQAEICEDPADEFAAGPRGGHAFVHI